MSVFQLVFLCVVVVVVSSFFYLSLFEHTMIQWVHIWWTNQRNFQQQLNSNSTSDSKTHRHIPFALWFLLYKRKPIELRLSLRVVCCKWDEYLFALWLWLWSILKHIATLSLLMNKMKRNMERNAIIVWHTCLTIHGLNWICVLLFFVICKYIWNVYVLQPNILSTQWIW